MNYGQQVRSVFVVSLVVSVVVGATAAVAWVLVRETSFLDQLVVPTCLIMATASACGIACASLQARGSRVLPAAGIVLALAAAALQTVGVWVNGLPTDYGRMTWAVTFFAVACGHMAALALARLAPRYLWTLAVAFLLVFGVATLGALRLLTDFVWPEWSDRLLSIMVILDLAVTILVPYCHWRSRDFVARGAWGRCEEHARNASREAVIAFANDSSASW